MVKAPGVITGRYGTIGKVFYEEDNFWPLNTTLWVSNFHGNHERFIYYLLQRVDYETHSGKSGVPGVNRNDLHGELVRIPDTVDEQRLIAAFLLGAEELVGGLEKLIAKKRAIKQGMMQELLTGRTRLQGFTGTWMTSHLAAVANVDPESLSPATTSPTEMIDYISLEDVSRGSIMKSAAYRFEQAPSRARRQVRPGDVLFGTVRPNLQSHAHYTGGLRNPVASTGFAVIRSRPGITDPNYLGQWVLSSGVMAQIDRIIAGSNYPAVSSGDVRRLELLLPSEEEQAAIGSILRDADTEIEVAGHRLEVARAIKQGMMQELLTGRTRIPAAKGDTV
nr:hypothetical protein BJQ95_00753 [Cryobacterium sp. SO1]